MMHVVPLCVTSSGCSTLQLSIIIVCMCIYTEVIEKTYRSCIEEMLKRARIIIISVSAETHSLTSVVQCTRYKELTYCM